MYRFTHTHIRIHMFAGPTGYLLEQVQRLFSTTLLSFNFLNYQESSTLIPTFFVYSFVYSRLGHFDIFSDEANQIESLWCNSNISQIFFHEIQNFSLFYLFRGKLKVQLRDPYSIQF